MHRSAIITNRHPRAGREDPRLGSCRAVIGRSRPLGGARRAPQAWVLAPSARMTIRGCGASGETNGARMAGRVATACFAVVTRGQPRLIPADAPGLAAAH